MGGVWCLVQGLLSYMLQLYLHYLISTFSEPCYNSTPKSHINSKKRHIDPQKVKKVKKVKKSQKNPIFFFGAHFVTKMLIKCSINLKKSYFRSKKSKKFKNFFFYFFAYWVKKKSHLYIYFLVFGPPHPSKKSILKNGGPNFFKNKIFNKSTPC